MELPWLPRLAADFRSRLTSIVDAVDVDWGTGMRALATQYLELNQAIALARALGTLRARGESPSLTKFKLGLVSNATVDFVKPFLEVSALRHGIALEIVAANFGQFAQEAMDPASLVNRARPDAVLLAVDHRGLPFRAEDSSRWPPFDHRPAWDQISGVCEAFQVLVAS